MIIRDCTLADLPAVQSIYGHHALHGFGTFEEEPPSLQEMTARYTRIVSHPSRFPYLVAADEAGGRVLGFAYASEFRTRSAYRHTCEDSVYIAPEAIRTGVGRALLAPLIERCRAAGLREMLAVIGDSENAGSIGLHRSFGFEPVGTFRNVGYKLGRWVDVVLMQLTLVR